MELNNMGSIQIDIRDNEILREVWDEVWAEGTALGIAQGKAEGKAEGKTEGLRIALRVQLQAKFGAIPVWADCLVQDAPASQLETWLKQVLVADTMQAALGV